MGFILGLYGVYIGIMENKMETGIRALLSVVSSVCSSNYKGRGCRVYGCRVEVWGSYKVSRLVGVRLGGVA